MKINLICDCNQNEAAERLLKMVHGFQNEEIVVLTPENSTLWAEGFLAATSQNGAISGVLVTNTTRLFSKMYPALALASNQFCCMLTKKAVMHVDLSSFQKSSKDFGFAKQMYELIRQMGQSGINANSLFVDGKNALNLKLLDIGNIWQEYKKLMPQNMFDSATQMQMIKNIAKDGFFSNKIVCFVGYDDFSEEMIAFIEEVVNHSKSVYASVVEADNTKYVNSCVCDALLEIAKRTNAETVFDRKTSADGRALHIATNLFAKQKVAKEVLGLKLFSCKSRRAEAAFVADEILQNVVLGSRMKDFEIVVPNVEDYGNLLKEALCERGITCYQDSGKSASYHPLFKLIQNYLRLAISKRRVKDVLSILKNVLMKFDADQIAVYENFCDKYGIEFDDFSKSLSVGQADCNFAIAKSIHKVCCDIIKMLPQKQENANEYIANIFAFLNKFGISDSLSEYAKKQTAEENEVCKKIFDTAKELAADMQLVLADECIDIKSFYDIWQSGVESIQLKLVPPILDSVLISNFSTSKHTKKPFIFIVGATESDFPGLLQDSGVLTDRELDEMESKYKIVMRPTVKHVNALQKQKACELLQNATKELVITYPIKAGGEDQYASSIINSLSSICLRAGKPLEIESSEIQNYAQAREQFLQKAQTKFGIMQLMQLMHRRMRSNQSLFGCADIFGSAKKVLESQGLYYLESQKSETNIENGKKLFFPKGKTSISQLETYFSCPYMHFMRYGLGIREKEKAELQAFDIGNFLHKCLEKLTKKLIGRTEHISDDEFSKLMKSVLVDVVKEEKYQAKVNALQLEALKQEACRLCYAVVVGIEHSGFKPKAAEVVFGKNGELPAVNFDGTKVVLEGKIDRMDTCGTMVRLIDYKTGQIDLGIDNLYYGKKIQLFAYLLSVLQDGNYKPAGVFYLPIKSTFRKDSNLLESYRLQGYFSGAEEIVSELDHDLSLENPKSALVEASYSTSKENKLLGKKVLKTQPHIVSSDDLIGLSNYAKKVIEGAIKEIECGNIDQAPLDMAGSRPCDYCVFKNMCKIDNHPEKVRHELDKLNVAEVIGAKENGTNI